MGFHIHEHLRGSDQGKKVLAELIRMTGKRPWESLEPQHGKGFINGPENDISDPRQRRRSDT